MKTKLFSLFLVLVASIGNMHSSVKIGNLYYNLYTDQTAAVTHPPHQTPTTGNYDTENLTVANIPSSIEYNGITYDVTSIGDSAFFICNSLRSVTIPNSVITIGRCAFETCFPASISIPNSVTKIGYRAFRASSSLKSVTLGNNVTIIEDEAFVYCTSLTSITIPYSVTTIGSGAFYGCNKLTSVIWNAKKCNTGNFGNQVTSFTFGDEVEVIPAKCCYEMSKLTSISIPNSVTKIGSNAFYKCTGLTSVTIPNSVSGIYSNAFYGCSGLTSVTMGNSIEVIDSYVFFQCTGITSITIPVNVVSIGDGAFAGCSNLTSVTWNSRNYTATTGTLYNNPFSDVRSQITSFTFGEEVESIPNYLCNYMRNLLSISLPNSVTNIGSQAFAYCSGLTSVTIPEDVTNIGEGPFYGCSGLTSVIWNAKNCPTLEKDGTIYPPFYANKENITSFIIGNKVESIPSGCCYGLSKLTNINIPNNITNIGRYAFSGCTGLTTVIIPNNVINIGEKAFASCTGLTSITCKGNTPPEIGTEPFYNTNDCPIYVPCGISALYEVSWPQYESRIQYDGCSGESEIYFIVTFVDWDESIIDKQAVEKGHAATAPANPTREGYTFIGWDKDFTNVQSDLIVTAQYTPNNPSATYYTVTFKDWDGTILDTQQVEKGHAATAPANPTREGYTFTGWDKDFSNVQSDLTVTALYEKNETPVEKFTVTFKDWDGTTLKTEQVEKGQSATAPANPTREGYTFVGWDKDFSHVLSDLTVIALYTQNAPSITYYTVTFKDWNGTVLKAEQVENGKSATAPANPTREGYTFIGWDKSSANVQSDLIVTAQYIQNSPEPSGETMSFVGFESTSENPLSNQIYAENLIQNKVNVTLVETDATKHKYSINLTNGGEGSFTMGGVSFSYTYSQAGKTAYKTYIEYIQPNGADREISIPTKTGEQVKVVLVEACAGVLVNGVSTDLVAGDNVLTSQNGTIVLKSASTKPKISAILPLSSTSATNYTVAFVDWDATVLKTQQVTKGQSATAPANPTREDYTFTGWDKDFSNVQSDLIVIAQYTQNAPIYYTVTFKDWDGTVLKNEQVERGKSAMAPANPTREGYTFVGWDKYFGNVRSDLIVTALYTQNASTYYTVTFKDWDGTVLKTEQVEEGTIPSYTGATPTRQETAEFTYTFAGWTPEIAAATSDATYTATYTATRKSYTITWLQDDGSLIDKTTVEYGQTPTHADPTKAATAEYTYTFAGWSPEIVVVTKDATYTATYDATPVSEGVEDVSADDIAPRKVMIDGNVYILRGEKVYTLQGQEVK